MAEWKNGVLEERRHLNGRSRAPSVYLAPTTTTVVLCPLSSARNLNASSFDHRRPTQLNAEPPRAGAGASEPVRAPWAAGSFRAIDAMRPIPPLAVPPYIGTFVELTLSSPPAVALNGVQAGRSAARRPHFQDRMPKRRSPQSPGKLGNPSSMPLKDDGDFKTGRRPRTLSADGRRG